MPRKLPQFVICKLCGRTFRAVSWSHLHYAHGKSGSHPVREYKRHFRLRHAYSPATRKLLGDHSIERAKKRGRHWTRERIVAEIRELAAAGHVVLQELRRWTQEGHPANYNAVYRDYCSLAIYARKFFDSWDAACIAAGIGVQRLRPGPKPASGKPVGKPASRAGRNRSRS